LKGYIRKEHTYKSRLTSTVWRNGARKTIGLQLIFHVLVVGGIVWFKLVNCKLLYNGC